MTDMFTSITHQIDAVRQCGGTVLVAIEGRCASGKSTLAAQLSEHYNCPLIHMDEFFLRPEQRTPSRYAVWSSQEKLDKKIRFFKHFGFQIALD